MSIRFGFISMKIREALLFFAGLANFLYGTFHFKTPFFLSDAVA